MPVTGNENFLNMMDTIDFNQAEQYTLSIRVGAEGVAAGVFNPLAESSSQVLQVENLPVDESLSLTANVRQLFGKHEWLHSRFRHVNVLVATRRFTLVPSEWFGKGQETVFFYHNHPWQGNEEVLGNALRTTGTMLLFGMDKSLRLWLDGQYPEVRYCAQVAPLIEAFAAQSRLGNTRKMFAHLRREYMDVCCYDNGQLLLANSYSCSLTPDRIYYLLYVWQALGFEQERDELHLCGVLDDRDALLSGLREFVRQVFVMNPPQDIDLRSVLSFEIENK